MRAEQDDSMEKIRQMCELNHASYEVDYSDCQVGLFILFVILKGWFTKNASWVHMKEFSELIRMVYATYSNSSPIVRNLKIKN